MVLISTANTPSSPCLARFIPDSPGKPIFRTEQFPPGDVRAGFIPARGQVTIRLGLIKPAPFKFVLVVGAGLWTRPENLLRTPSEKGCRGGSGDPPAVFD
jgi:hypothetical protein